MLNESTTLEAFNRFLAERRAQIEGLYPDDPIGYFSFIRAIEGWYNVQFDDERENFGPIVNWAAAEAPWEFVKRLNGLFEAEMARRAGGEAWVTTHGSWFYQFHWNTHKIINISYKKIGRSNVFHWLYFFRGNWIYRGYYKPNLDFVIRPNELIGYLEGLPDRVM
jgi:hypothetical protein